MTQQNLTTTVNNSYSQALYELTLEDNSTKKVEDQVSSILKLISENKDFVNLITNPTISHAKQNKTIEIICEKFNFHEIFLKFLKLLIFKRRLFFLEKILKDFLLICSSKRGEIIAKLTSAKELNKNDLENITNSLKDNFGSNLKLKFNHDPSILGGLILQVGSIMIDTSIKNKLQQIENNMIGA